MSAAEGDPALVLLELGAVVVALAVLARVSARLGVSAIPGYLLAGLVIGDGGLVQLELSEGFVELGAEIGVVLLLLTLGLEYTADELRVGLVRGWPVAVVDVAANFTPGLAAGLLLGWDPLAAALLGGATYASSSGVVAKVLADLDRLGNRETPSMLSLLVIEDLVMALYLPVMAVLLAGGDVAGGAVSLVVAVSAVAVVLWIALRHGPMVSRLITSRSDEALLLSVLGVTLLVAGAAQRVQVSAAVGAFLVGIALSGPVQERASVLLGPLRDLFAALFFLFFSLQIDPSDLPPVVVAAGVLALATALTKAATVWWAAGRAGVGRRGRMRAGTAMVARGEFSIVIAGIGVVAGVEPDLGPLAAAYVLVLAVAGPLLTRVADDLADVRWGRGATAGRG